MQAILKSTSNVAVRSRAIQDNCLGHKLNKHRNCPLLPPFTLSERLSSSFFKYSNTTSVLLLKRRNTYERYYIQMPPCITMVSGSPNGLSVICVRNIFISSSRFEKEPLKPSSKVEETVKAIKEKSASGEVPVKKSLKDKIMHEVMHYYHGFRLLFIDVSISGQYLWGLLGGKTLSRREKKLLVRTVGDIFRFIPFSVFIIVPFMELLLPVVIKLFPGMLPSTFQTAKEKEEKLKQSLKVKLEMAKFLQTTLDEMSVQSKDKNNDSAKEFTEFFKKIRSSGETPSNEEIIKFSTLFEDDITLDSLSKQQLAALCRVLDMNPIGTTSLLRFQIRMRLRNLAADDKVIVKEGIDSLTVAELQAACQARAMRAYGVSQEKLKQQLSQWLDLSVNEKVPTSLLLLSRALLLPDSTATTEQLKATITALPEAVEVKAKAAVSEREGALDNKTKIELLKSEEKVIKEEQTEETEMDKKKLEESSKEEIIDTAPVLSASTGIKEAEKVVVKAESEIEGEITTKDIETLETALDELGKEKKKMMVEKEELSDLKEELHEYQEDVEELKEVLATAVEQPKIGETKGAKNLFKKVNSMISKLDIVLEGLENKEKKIKEAEIQKDEGKSEELVKIDELIDVIKRIQKVPDDTKVRQISKVLEKIDDDRDGSISVEEVLKVIELIGTENVQLSAKQMDEILDLMDKEEALELEDQIEKALEKQSAAEKIASGSQKVDTSDSSQVRNSKKKNNVEDLVSMVGSATVEKQPAAMSVSANGSTNKQSITEPKDSNNDSTKKL